jgi:hypothetical protein
VLFSRTAGLVDVAANLSDDSWALPVSDVPAWSAAIRAVFADPARGQAGAAEGRAIVGRRYTWAAAAAALAAVYREAIAEQRAGREPGPRWRRSAELSA